MSKSKGISRRDAIGAIGMGFALPFLSGSFVDVNAQGNNDIGIDYTLQQKIPGLVIPNTVTVIGCGGFGSWPAIFAALTGVKKLVLIDMGTVDSLDMARAPFLPSFRGKPKVEALRDLILQFRPDATVTTKVQFFAPKDADLLEGTVVFDGTNDMTLGVELPKIAAKRRMKYVQGFYNADRFGVTNGFVKGAKYSSGAKVPVWAGGAAMSGILAVHSAFLKPVNFVGKATDISMTPGQVSERLGAAKVDVDK